MPCEKCEKKLKKLATPDVKNSKNLKSHLQKFYKLKIHSIIIFLKICYYIHEKYLNFARVDQRALTNYWNTAIPNKNLIPKVENVKSVIANFIKMGNIVQSGKCQLCGRTIADVSSSNMSII
ncbi:hypothetical protein YYG_02071 [Plasmodium vinckei petteri]|uniref:Uncharacterized protein n=1 Tax=Plasmodium vinckei petteri TaxID=138298 RepID=W7B583_PLAVN|nr:hypothetical protein YYG_02071 [Plasmodium vinckei petteri]